ncbi:MAG: hypothetical protein HY901_19660 [Deltaproteobacteria bacterium]|nr:hypothetical protein [Deltaproteobacteria bacterium]
MAVIVFLVVLVVGCPEKSATPEAHSAALGALVELEGEPWREVEVRWGSERLTTTSLQWQGKTVVALPIWLASAAAGTRVVLACDGKVERVVELTRVVVGSPGVQTLEFLDALDRLDEAGFGRPTNEPEGLMYDRIRASLAVHAGRIREWIATAQAGGTTLVARVGGEEGGRDILFDARSLALLDEMLMGASSVVRLDGQPQALTSTEKVVLGAVLLAAAATGGLEAMTLAAAAAAIGYMVGGVIADLALSSLGTSAVASSVPTTDRAAEAYGDAKAILGHLASRTEDCAAAVVEWGRAAVATWPASNGREVEEAAQAAKEWVGQAARGDDEVKVDAGCPVVQRCRSQLCCPWSSGTCRSYLPEDPVACCPPEDLCGPDNLLCCPHKEDAGVSDAGRLDAGPSKDAGAPDAGPADGGACGVNLPQGCSGGLACLTCSNPDHPEMLSEPRCQVAGSSCCWGNAAGWGGSGRGLVFCEEPRTCLEAPSSQGGVYRSCGDPGATTCVGIVGGQEHFQICRPTETCVGNTGCRAPESFFTICADARYAGYTCCLPQNQISAGSLCSPSTERCDPVKGCCPLDGSGFCSWR